MKFGKSYMETLASPSFPQEWREGAIEYKQLKKLINGVVAELESLGLGADVLRDLIVPPRNGEGQDDDTRNDSDEEVLEELDDRLSLSSRPLRRHSLHVMHRRHSASPSDPGSSSQAIATSSSAEDCEECAHDFQKYNEEQEHSSAASEWVASIAHAKHSRRMKSQRRRAAGHRSSAIRPSSSPDEGDSSSNVIAEEGNDVEVMHPPLIQANRPQGRVSVSSSRSKEKSSSDRANSLYSGMGKKDLVELRRQLSHKSDKRSLSQSRNVSSEDQVHDWGGHGWRERPGPKPAPPKSKPVLDKMAGKWVHGKDGRRARAEYELGGTSEKPIPRIRLFVESPVQSGDETTAGDEADSEGDSEEDDAVDDSTQDASIVEIPDTPKATVASLHPTVDQPRSPIIKPQQDGKRRTRVREIVIPLSADTEFLDTLTGALSNLSSLQESQRVQFKQDTDVLCKTVAQVASPYGNKHDLYVWREIFSLWSELQIFKSLREKDRGELSVDETEARLKHFADELAKRGWSSEALALDATQRKPSSKRMGKMTKRTQPSGSALPMKDPRSISALEDFLRLNLALLDVKKFQRVNVEAARKILKKHDKRTALTASSDLGAFVEHQESMRATTASVVAGVGVSGLVGIPGNSITANNALVSSHGAATHPSLAALLPSSTSALISSSLPHILLSLMTTTLLPILPSIDDYSCAICTSVAWRPIRLDCSHLFCIRCLVKLQKQGKADCPLCRAKDVVASADERNMDEATVKFLKAWFPKEVSEKSKENERDRHKEEMQELGFVGDNDKCVVM